MTDLELLQALRAKLAQMTLRPWSQDAHQIVAMVGRQCCNNPPYNGPESVPECCGDFEPSPEPIGEMQEADVAGVVALVNASDQLLGLAQRGLQLEAVRETAAVVRCGWCGNSFAPQMCKPETGCEACKPLRAALLPAPPEGSGR